MPRSAAPAAARRAPASPRPSASRPAPSASSASTAPASSSLRKRKGIPHKAPARTAPYPTPTSSSQLLRVLLRDADRPSSSLDNRRCVLPPPRSDRKQRKKPGIGSRDALPPAPEGYGRGRRATNSALPSIFLAEGDYEASTAGSRGRSPGAGVGSRRTAVSSVRGGLGTSASRRGPTSPRQQHQATMASTSAAAGAGYYAAPPYHHAAAAELPYHPSAAASPSRMARALSAGAPHFVPTPPYFSTPPVQAAATVPSPLARSFSANGAERVDRQRTPSGLGRAVDLGNGPLA
ncbi:hypothetical protein Rhopal_005640-T1 [Rhodotorula paludigena]|uniref:Uncharacterized protein n=1 Tax=Rhodotorula paludigena TaxID=86838 RepID=A0AAV5GRS5_9BASI|nr:hypothetical protein Rhopal_005640-T1 [Rhodotorula paludigena]